MTLRLLIAERIAPLRTIARRLGARSLTAALLACAVSGCAAPAPAPHEPEGPTGFRANLVAATATRQMVASAHPLATQTGLEILRAGGSALDAAIATQMVLGLVEPQSSGIGGGAFLLHWDTRRVQTFDGRETAPLAADENLFLDAQGRPLDFLDAVVGGRSVGVPGLLRMLELAHRQHGKLSWSRLFEPAIELAERGFPVTPRLHALLAAEKHLPNNPAARAYFYNADGTARAEGSMLRNPELAATLRVLARDGADALYRGPIATDVVTAVTQHPRNPGRMTLADLESYRAKERPPLCADYKAWRVCGMGPPSSGGIAIAQMLGMLAVRNIAVVPPIEREGGWQPQVDAVHLFSEIGRLVFADRAMYVADSDFVPVDVAALTDTGYLRQRAALIGAHSMGRATAGQPAGVKSAYAPDTSLRDSGTSHISVVDASGNAVALTTTIEAGFGARLMVRGFLLNNQLTDFAFVPREPTERGAQQALPVANRVQPGKRPRSSMAPTLVFDRATGALVATLGSPGGAQIINYVGKSLVAVLDWRLDIQDAISLPNFGSRNGPTEVERGRIGAEIITQLQARGHAVQVVPMTSGLHGIVRVRRADGSALWSGGADPRREGTARGD